MVLRNIVNDILYIEEQRLFMLMIYVTFKVKNQLRRRAFVFLDNNIDNNLSKIEISLYD